MSDFDEITHLVKHLVSQALAERQGDVYGHIASYDPALHRVRIVLPSLRDADTDTPLLSPWIPLGAAAAGNGWGLQIAPIGGATFENPTAGEQVKLDLIDSELGVGVAAHQTHNNQSLPPFPQLQAGEIGLKSPSGSFLLLHANGDAEINNATTKVIITAHGDVNITSSSGDVNVTAHGKVKLTAPDVEVSNGGSVQAVKLADGSNSTVLKAQ